MIGKRKATPNFWALVAESDTIEAIPDDLTTDADIHWAGEVIGAIMRTPAPDAAALRWKLDYVLAECGLDGEDLAQTLADLDRFLPARSPSPNG